MKKIFSFILLFALVIMFPFASKTNMAHAEESDTLRTTANAYLQQFVDYNNADAKVLVDRTAGTYGEKLAATQIVNILTANGLEAKTNNSTTDGLQEFEFYNTIKSKKTSSQNIIFTIKGTSSDKKIVLSTNYDNNYSGYASQNDQVITTGEKYSEGVNASGASVAVLLALSKTISPSTLPFDVEFVFFGSMYSNNAGANYYNQTMTSTEREKTLFMIDLSRIAVGNKLYFYTSEVGSVQDSYLANTLGIKQFKNSLHGSAESADNRLGYQTAGYSDSAQIFAGIGLNYVHIFAGDYEEGVFSGIREINGKSNVINTENDKIEYLIANHTTMLSNNMFAVATSLTNLINNDQVVSQGSAKNQAINYAIINNNYTYWIAFFVILALLIVAIVVHYVISKNTVKFAFDNKITGVMIQVDDQEDDENQDKKE